MSNTQMAEWIRDTERDITLDDAKTYLKGLESQLLSRHLRGAPGRQITDIYTKGIDILIKRLYEDALKRFLTGYKGSEPCLVALGGYGRGELNPRSDIDLMLLYNGRLDKSIESICKKLLYLLWDTGLDIGFSIRSIKESIELAYRDSKTMTSFLDSRLISGNVTVYDMFFTRLYSRVITPNRERLIEVKVDESRLRHERYGGSVYILEPNVKEGKGGLRDIHTALWIARIKEKGLTLESLAQKGVITLDEKIEIEESVDFLLRIRNDLHFTNRKKVDQLTFDSQERIAELFGYRDTGSSLGVELFMRDYYIHANRINSYSTMLISRLTYSSVTPLKELKESITRRHIGRWCWINQDMIDLKVEPPVEDLPSVFFDIFEAVQEHGLEIHPLTKEWIKKNLFLIDDDFRSSPEYNKRFLSIIGRRTGVYKALNNMHSVGFLGRYIPEFEDVTFKVQHDLYHIYTVDVHSLFAVMELELLSTDRYRQEFPLLASLIEGVERFELLVLATLLHDIGKSGGKGHAERGGDIVKTILRRMNFSEGDIELVSFLVKNHLLLADIAQHRDIHDLKLIIEIAKEVEDIDRLNMLYLLTFADVKAVGPDVWTQWKAALFQELYFRVRKVIEKGTFELPGIDEEMERIGRAIFSMASDSLPSEAIEVYMSRFPFRYYLSNPVEDLALHIHLLERFDDTGFITHIRHNHQRAYTEFIVCTYDTYGLFSKIAGVLTANNVNILGAQINTSKDGIALDILRVTSSMGKVIDDEEKWNKINDDLRAVLEGRLRVEALVARRKPSILERRFKPRVDTRVEIDNDVSDEFTVIDVYTEDRIGLLYDITSTLTSLGLYIHVAKITTRGNQVADVFYVKDIFGQKITDDDKQESVKDSLIKRLIYRDGTEDDIDR